MLFVGTKNSTDPCNTRLHDSASHPNLTSVLQQTDQLIILSHSHTLLFVMT